MLSSGTCNDTSHRHYTVNFCHRCTCLRRCAD